MSPKEKIILIDDHPYEVDLLNLALEKLHLDYEIIYFSNAKEAYTYFEKTTDPIFIIISDINMPGMNGIELRKEIDRNTKLKKKTIPYIFFSSSTKECDVDEAYDYNAQGYFKKPMGLDEMTELFDSIIKYWQKCRHPNKQEPDVKFRSPPV